MSKLLDSYNLTDDQLTERANIVIESAKLNNTENVINIFEKIALPFKNGNFKKQLFQKIFDLSNIDYTWSETFGFILYSKNRTTKTVVSHMDLISPFNRGFEKCKVYKIEDDKLIGALDNTFTNAVVINHILNNQHSDTTYLFTLDEETTQHAIRDYMKGFGTEQFIINLDVTHEGWDSNVAIEYDEPCWEICKQINENIDNPYFTTDRECDDMDEVIKADGKGFSYCIPSKGNIHSYKNYTLIDKIKPYMDGLEFLVNDLCLKVTNPNIEHIKIDKAIKCKDLDELIVADVKKVVKSSYHNPYKNSNHYKRDKPVKVPNSFNINKEFSKLTFSKKFNKFVNNKFDYDVTLRDVHNFVVQHLNQKSSFIMNDLFQEFYFTDVGSLESAGFIREIHENSIIGKSYMFIAENIFEGKDITNELNKVIITLTKGYDKNLVQKMKKFLKTVINTREFTVDEFEEYFTDSGLVYYLSSFNVFVENDDDNFTLSLNNKLIKKSHYKVWKIASNFKTIDSLKLFEYLFEYKNISYSYLVNLEMHRNLNVVDKLLDKLVNANLFSENKEYNEFNLM